jgi:predicted DNA-binding transcriptional regulator YafY
LCAELREGAGVPVIEEARWGARRVLRLRRDASVPEAAAYDVLFLYFALTVFDFLEGTVLKRGARELWERLYRAVPETQRIRLADFARKFYAVPYAMKDYRAFDDTLNVIVQCLVYQRRLRIDYAGTSGKSRIHEFDPYTLAMYRGGLYLIGHSHRLDAVVYLAVERIRVAEKLPEKFAYPKRYSPERHTEGTFGIIEGPRTRVRLLLLNEETTTFVSSRRLHPTQRFRRRVDGTALLTMEVRGTTELANWILSLSPWVKVLEPRGLRDEVRDRLAEAAGLYARPARKHAEVANAR